MNMRNLLFRFGVDGDHQLLSGLLMAAYEPTRETADRDEPAAKSHTYTAPRQSHGLKATRMDQAHLESGAGMALPLLRVYQGRWARVNLMHYWHPYVPVALCGPTGVQSE